MKPDLILDRLIFAGGPPRSGTTLLAKLLNSHTHIITAINNSSYERWSLYYSPDRVGIVSDIRYDAITSEEIREHLLDDLVRNDLIWGIAPSRKVSRYPLVRVAQWPDTGTEYSVKLSYRLKSYLKGMVGKNNNNSKKLLWCHIPLSKFKKNWHICLKSPELVFVLPQLAGAFPHVPFVLVFRPVIEIAESMFRKSFEWKFAYHRRWHTEVDDTGKMIPPPGVPQAWYGLWTEVTDFQRCVIYACSYLNAMVESLDQLPRERVFIYNHVSLRENPEQVLMEMSDFLNIDVHGFDKNLIRNDLPTINAEQRHEYEEIMPKLVAIHDFTTVDKLFGFTNN